MKTSFKRFRITGLAFFCCVLGLMPVGSPRPSQASTNTAADALLDDLNDTSKSSRTLSGSLTVRRTEDGEYLDFLPSPIFRMFTISSSGSTTTIGYGSSSSQTAENDGVEFGFQIAPNGELIFDKAANLSGGYSDSGMFYVEDGKLTFQGDTTLNQNKSYDVGGAINIRKFSTSAVLTFQGTATFSSNEAENSGGALAMLDAVANFAKTVEFKSNSSAGGGGALDMSGDSRLNITGAATFSGNTATAGDGGAVLAIGGKLNFGGALTVTNNKATDNGGAFYMEGVEMTVAGIGTFTGNQAEFGEDSSATGGGAIAMSGGTIHFKDTAIFGGNTSTLGNSAKSAGGALYIDNNATLTFDKSATFQNNKVTGGDGGAVYVNGGTLSFADSTFTDNSADRSGGALYLFGSATFTGSTTTSFKNNKAAHGDGGAIYLTGGGSVNFNVDTSFENNGATDGISGGGAIYADSDSSLTFKAGTKTTFQNNKTLTGSDGETPGGGAVFLDGVGRSSGTIQYGWNSNGTIKFLANEAVGQGGAMAMESSAAQFSGVEFTGNTSKFSNDSGHGGGGAMYVDDSLVVFNESVKMDGNKATNGSGGGIYATATGIVDAENPVDGIRFTKGGTIEKNTAKEGGAFFLDASAISFTGTTSIEENEATAGSGGAFAMIDSLASFSGTTNIRNNKAKTANGNGGAFSLDDSWVTFSGTTTIEKNAADGAGGAFYVTNQSAIHFAQNSKTTLTGNTAATGKGGAIYMDSNGELTLDLAAKAIVDIEATTGHEVVLNAATLSVNTAKDAKLNIKGGFIGDTDSSFRVIGPGNVNLTGNIDYKGSTEIDGGGILSLGGTKTYGNLSNATLTVGETGTLIFNVADQSTSARLQVYELDLAGKINVTLPSDDAGSQGMFKLIEVENGGNYYDWSAVENQITSSIGILVLKLEYAEEHDYDPMTNNLLSASVTVDLSKDWTFDLSSDFALRTASLNDAGKTLTVTGSGTLFLGKNANVGEWVGNGNIALNSDLTPTVGTTLTVNKEATYDGTLSGAGTLAVNVGTGNTFNLTGENGENSYVGGTKVQSGTLKGNTTSLQGAIDISSGATVEFSQKEDGIFGKRSTDTLTGAGSLVVNNQAKIVGNVKTDTSLQIAGTHDFTGDTTVKSGWMQLIDDASLSGTKNVFVEADGGLGGYGTIGTTGTTTTVRAGGVVQAFGGKMTFDGDLVFSQGAFLYVIANGENTDVVVVNGTATINGAKVKVVSVESETKENERFKFFEVASGGTLTGEFNSTVDDADGWSFVLSKSGLSYYLTGHQSDPPPPPVVTGLSRNQTATKKTTDWIAAQTFTENSPAKELATIIKYLNGLNPDPDNGVYSPTYLKAMDLFSGASRANSLKLGMYSPAATMFNRMAMGETVYTYGGIPYNNGYGPLDEYGMRGETTTVRGQNEYCNPHGDLYDACSVPCYSENNHFWLDVVHVQTNAGYDGNSGAYGVARTGFFIGYDALKMSGTRVGLTFGYFAPYLWQRSDRYDADDYHLGLLLERQYMGAEIYGYLGYAHQEYKTNRYVSFANDPSEHLTGGTSGDSFYASFEIAKPRWTNTGLVVRPLLGIDYLLTAQKGYGEQGGIYALNFDSATYDQLFLRLGVHLKKETCRYTGVVRLQYIYEALGESAPKSTAHFAVVGGSPAMNIYGVDPGRDYFNVGTGLNLLLNGPRTRRLGLDYNFNISKRISEHAVGLIYTESF